MSAKTDLDNALSILDAGITAHVTALKNSHAATASAQAAANDESYITSLTSKVLGWADVLSASTSVPTPAPVVVAPVAAPVAPVAVAVAPVAPVAAPVLPAAVLHDPGATPAMIAAAIAAQNAQSPSAAAPTPGAFAAFEAELRKLIPSGK